MTFSIEPLFDVWDEAQPLLDAHWAEIAHFDDIPLAPRLDAYTVVAKAGSLPVFTARDAGRLVGYAAFFVDRHMHYASMLQATQDVLFLLPEYRNAGNGHGLIAFAEAALRAVGVQCIVQRVKLAHDFSPLLDHMGYERIETIHVKRLDR